MFEGFLAPSHMFIVALIALLLFGDRLPEVMRSVGRGVMEFKKGLRGIESAFEAAATTPQQSQSRSTVNGEIAKREVASVPRIEAPTGEPQAETGAVATVANSEPAQHADEAHTAAAHAENSDSGDAVHQAT